MELLVLGWKETGGYRPGYQFDKTTVRAEINVKLELNYSHSASNHNWLRFIYLVIDIQLHFMLFIKSNI